MVHTIKNMKKAFAKFKDEDIVTINVINKFLFVYVNNIPVTSFNNWKIKIQQTEE